MLFMPRSPCELYTVKVIHMGYAGINSTFKKVRDGVGGLMDIFNAWLRWLGYGGNVAKP
jgi:hypothetical protein